MMNENIERTPLMRSREELQAMLPRVWIGYVIAAAFIAAEFIPAPAGLSADGGSVILFGVALVGMVYWLVCVFQIHQTLMAMAAGKYPNAAWKAALFHLIPVFSLYWIFKWPGDAADYLQSINDSAKMPKYLAGVIFLAGFMIARFVDGGAGIAAIFSGLLLLNKRIEKAIDAY